MNYCIPARFRARNLIHVSRDEPLKRMSYEHELEMIAQDLLFLRRREVGKSPDVSAQFVAMHKLSVRISHTGCSSQRRKPARRGHLYTIQTIRYDAFGEYPKPVGVRRGESLRFSPTQNIQHKIITFEQYRRRVKLCLSCCCYGE